MNLFCHFTWLWVGWANWGSASAGKGFKFVFSCIDKTPAFVCFDAASSRHMWSLQGFTGESATPSLHFCHWKCWIKTRSHTCLQLSGPPHFTMSPNNKSQPLRRTVLACSFGRKQLNIFLNGYVLLARVSRPAEDVTVATLRCVMVLAGGG